MCESGPLRAGLENTHAEAWGWTWKDRLIPGLGNILMGRVSAWCNSSKSRISRRTISIWTVGDSRSPWTNFTIYPIEYNTRQQIGDNESGWQDRHWGKKRKGKEYERKASDIVLVQVHER